MIASNAVMLAIFAEGDPCFRFAQVSEPQTIAR
jgi:hypothetical protein